MDNNELGLRLRLHQLDACNVILGGPQRYDEQLMCALGNLLRSPTVQSRCDDFTSQRRFAFFCLVLSFKTKTAMCNQIMSRLVR